MKGAKIAITPFSGDSNVDHRCGMAITGNRMLLHGERTCGDPGREREGAEIPSNAPLAATSARRAQ